MPLIFGDKKSIEEAKKKVSSKKKAYKYIRFLSVCCGVFANAVCDWEYPKDGTPGVTLINTCSGCGKECIVEKVPVF